MQVVILCGGFGTRLREETEYKPKPMVLIGNRPILWHIMNAYAAHGVTNFILALGYKGDIIRDYFLNYEFYNSDFTIHLGNHKQIQLHNRARRRTNWRVTLVETGEETMTGGRVKGCEPYIQGKDFFLTYGDGLADVDLKKLLQFHKRHGKLATVTGVNPPSRWGELITRNKHEVVTFIEKATLEKHPHHVNGGFFAFSREVFKYFPEDPACVLENQILQTLAEKGELMVYHHHGFWHAMDTYRDYLYLNDLWKSGKIPWTQNT